MEVKLSNGIEKWNSIKSIKNAFWSEN